MALNIISVAAATAVVGYDLLTNRPDISSSGLARILRALALTGSAAIGDSAVDVKVGNRVVATLFNTALDFPTNDAAKFDTAYNVPSGQAVSVIVTDAAATNPLNLLVDV